MIVPDANLLVYTVDVEAPRHEAARRWMEDSLSGTETVGFAWVALLAFLRVSTRATVFRQPLTVDQAFDVVDAWLSQPPALVIHPGERHHLLLRELLEHVGTAGNLVPDAHLAALAVEHGAMLASGDRDFQRFPKVRLIDPFERT